MGIGRLLGERREVMEMIKSWYFTFMTNQGVLRHSYVEVRAKNEEEAREAMVKNFGVQWGFQYEKEEMREALEVYGDKRYALIDEEGRVIYD